MPALRTLTTLALILPLLPTIPALTPTPAEVEFGKISGFTQGGAVVSHAGDYLTSTFCFCAAATPQPGRYSEASYLQFEYYNAHRNTTFVVNKLCLKRGDDASTCLRERQGDGATLVDGAEYRGPICKKWWDGVGRGGVDELCYWPAYGQAVQWWRMELPGSDVLVFNGQRRQMDTLGGQGPVLKGLEEAEGRCEALCEEHARLEVVRGSRQVQCHVVVYEDLDDMCDGCA